MNEKRQSDTTKIGGSSSISYDVTPGEYREFKAYESDDLKKGNPTASVPSVEGETFQLKN